MATIVDAIHARNAEALLQAIVTYRWMHDSHVGRHGLAGPPIYHAIKTNWLPGVELLLDAEINNLDPALILAANCGNIEIFDFLLSRGAQFDLRPFKDRPRSECGRIPSILECAINGKSVAVVQSILRELKRLQIAIPSWLSGHLIKLTITENQPQMLSSLHSAGFPIDQIHLRAPLELACEGENPTLILELVQLKFREMMARWSRHSTALPVIDLQPFLKNNCYSLLKAALKNNRLQNTITILQWGLNVVDSNDRDLIQVSIRSISIDEGRRESFEILKSIGLITLPFPTNLQSSFISADKTIAEMVLSEDRVIAIRHTIYFEISLVSRLLFWTI